MLKRKLFACLKLYFQPFIWTNDEWCWNSTHSASKRNFWLLWQRLWKCGFYIMECTKNHRFLKSHSDKWWAKTFVKVPHICKLWEACFGLSLNVWFYCIKRVTYCQSNHTRSGTVSKLIHVLKCYYVEYYYTLFFANINALLNISDNHEVRFRQRQFISKFN